ncbi:uncharacterized protein LOC133376732 [Rhineura floridana]|uniref:uncharacterized protein LOC133376732 n=1 Tax=Rhineura floridana TaxID=261503 RepID=UPI002AC89073|nr:uncharacterized protein LOC133376732 [Rhineura floridana]
MADYLQLVKIVTVVQLHVKKEKLEIRVSRIQENSYSENIKRPAQVIRMTILRFPVADPSPYFSAVFSATLCRPPLPSLLSPTAAFPVGTRTCSVVPPPFTRFRILLTRQYGPPRPFFPACLTSATHVRQSAPHPDPPPRNATFARQSAFSPSPYPSRVPSANSHLLLAYDEPLSFWESCHLATEAQDVITGADNRVALRLYSCSNREVIYAAIPTTYIGSIGQGLERASASLRHQCHVRIIGVSPVILGFPSE